MFGRHFAAMGVLLVAGSVLPCVVARCGEVSPQHASGSDPGSATDQSAEIRRWIEQLGSGQFAARQRAQSRLRRLGLQALDQLQQAQFDSDNEIAMAARHLIGSELIRWSEPTDSVEVQNTLAGYGSQSIGQREVLIKRLASFPDRDGLPALVRLVRFETEGRLSHVAAIALMQQPAGEDAQTRQTHADKILSVVAGSPRIPCQWLERYARDLTANDFDLSGWLSLLKQQRLKVDRNASQQIDSALLLQFVRVLAVSAVQRGKMQAAIELASANLDLVPPTTRDLIDAASWALDHELHPLVMELRQMHRRMFDRHAVLVYSAAEAAFRSGDTDQAESLARSALAIDPLPADAGDLAKLSDRDREDLAQRHREVARELQTRGFFRWADREYRSVVDRLGVDSIAAVITRVDLSLMYSDQFQHADVIDVLKPLLKRIATDDDFRKELLSRDVSPEELSARSFYHQGLLSVDRGDVEAAKVELEEAFRKGISIRIDALIAMYRIDGGQAWRERVDALLDREINRYEFEISALQSQRLQAGVFAEERLRMAMNQYAWLVGNTRGDYQQALTYSLRTVEMEPNNAPLMDTLARCYFATGQIDQAVATQRRAVELDPYFPPLVRQLKEFEAAQAQAQAQADKQAQPGGVAGPESDRDDVPRGDRPSDQTDR